MFNYPGIIGLGQVVNDDMNNLLAKTAKTIRGFRRNAAAWVVTGGNVCVASTSTNLSTTLDSSCKLQLQAIQVR